MRCSRCATDNLIKAHFCSTCGHPFTEEERQGAYDRTIYGKVDKLRKLKSIATMEIITGSLWFKILSVLIILLLGLFLLLTRKPLRIEPSNGYKIQYLEETGTYYLIAQQDTIAISLSAPWNTSQIVIRGTDETGNLIREEVHTTQDPLVLSVNGQSHYTLISSNGRKETGVLNVYLYKFQKEVKP